MTRVAHVITGLGTGGAELMLARLLPSLERRGFESMVVSLTTGGEVAERILALGVRVACVDLKPPRSLRGLADLVDELRRFRPDLVQTWMYHADLLGGLVAAAALRVPAVWNLRTTDPRCLPGHRRLLKACALLSGIIPARIVACSHAAVRAHADFGYSVRTATVIHNGFDVERLYSDLDGGRRVRAELGITDTSRVIGLVARFDPLKDHKTFLEAAGELAQRDADVRFILCGEGVTWENQQLGDWIARAQLEGRCFLLGRRSDIREVNSALDIATCSSTMEGMPNVVGEAMACGVPCVVTNVGDAALLVGDTGEVVTPASATALAAAWQNMLSRGPAELQRRGERARARIVDEFSLEAAAARYSDLYQSVLRAA